jgi:hypothetical protein
MEYTDQYVYVNVTDAVAAANPNTLNVVLNYSNDRVPYALVEVMSLSIETSTLVDSYFTLKVEEIGQNYLGYDNQGTALAVAPFNSAIDETGPDRYLYTMYGAPPKVMFGNPRSLTFYIVDTQGLREVIGGGNVSTYSMVLKVSYPKTGEIPPAYRSQIPL